MLLKSFQCNQNFSFKGVGVLINGNSTVLVRTGVERFLKPSSATQFCDLSLGKSTETSRSRNGGIRSQSSYHFQANDSITRIPDVANTIAGTDKLSSFKRLKSRNSFRLSNGSLKAPHVTSLSLDPFNNYNVLSCSIDNSRICNLISNSVKHNEGTLDSVKLHYSSPSTKPNAKANPDPQSDKPSLDQLQRVSNILQSSLDKLFTNPMDYTIYHPKILFIDNIRNVRTQGLPRYLQQFTLLKFVGHIKFAYIKFEVMNISMSHEEGRITLRWRIKGLSGLRVMLKFWKYKLWKWQEIVNAQETWYDGISYYDVGGDGMIFQHIADKVMEDKQGEIAQKRGLPLAAKLGALATIFPVPSLYYENGSHNSRSTIV